MNRVGDRTHVIKIAVFATGLAEVLVLISGRCIFLAPPFERGAANLAGHTAPALRETRSRIAATTRGTSYELFQQRLVLTLREHLPLRFQLVWVAKSDFETRDVKDGLKFGQIDRMRRSRAQRSET